MQAAFVDIGLAKDAFLYAGDYTANLGEDEPGARRPRRTTTPTWTTPGEGEARRASPSRRRRDRAHRGDAAQGPGDPGPGLQGIARAPRAPGSRPSSPSRAATSSTCPRSRHVGVSRRIHDDARARAPARHRQGGCGRRGGGFIVRTVARGQGRGGVRRRHPVPEPAVGAGPGALRARPGAAPLLHEEMDLTFRVVRDLFSPEIEEFLVDGAEAYEKVPSSTSRRWCPQLADRVKRYAERGSRSSRPPASRRRSRRRCGGGCG